ncbi:hypothetical protein AMELA_G00065900 [Ameiurus melas]|uniref:Uncharacterized protein n=1 Tax=Ameiurus melas TaxID=219545 RepID=A0A7J6B4T0_AMEME|nr:hypothetical protein AMELA_G00065900 [Ameiurus melas]
MGGATEWAWPMGLVAPQRIAYTMAAGKRRKQTIFRPAASSKKYEKKIIKIRKIGESQGKRPRKDVKAPTCLASLWC